MRSRASAGFSTGGFSTTTGAGAGAGGGAGGTTGSGGFSPSAGRPEGASAGFSLGFSTGGRGGGLGRLPLAATVPATDAESVIASRSVSVFFITTPSARTSSRQG